MTAALLVARSLFFVITQESGIKEVFKIENLH